MKDIIEKLQLLESDADLKRIAVSSIDQDKFKDLADKLYSGDLSLDDFNDQIESLSYTDYSMRRGEMGYDQMDHQDSKAWDLEKDEWDHLDRSWRDQEDDEDFDESLETSVKECSLGECGGEIPPTKQQDSVSMTVNMSGSGTGGMKDLLSVLRDIENKPSLPALGPSDDKAMIVDTEEEFANEPNEKFASIKDIMKSGNDLHKSKDSFSDKPYRGDNPMAVKKQLESLYQFVKSR